MPKDNVELIRTAYEAYARGDLASTVTAPPSGPGITERADSIRSIIVCVTERITVTSLMTPHSPPPGPTRTAGESPGPEER